MVRFLTQHLNVLRGPSRDRDENIWTWIALRPALIVCCTNVRKPTGIGKALGTTDTGADITAAAGTDGATPIA